MTTLRICIVAIFLVVCCSPAWATAPAPVQACQAGVVSGTSVTCTFGSSPTTGNSLVWFVYISALNHTLSAAPANVMAINGAFPGDGNTDIQSFVFWCRVTSTNGCTGTSYAYSFGNSVTACVMGEEWSNVFSIAAIDNLQTGTNASSTSYTSPAANAVVGGAVAYTGFASGANTTFTAGSGNTQLGSTLAETGFTCGQQYNTTPINLNASGAQSATFGTAAAGLSSTILMKPVSGGGLSIIQFCDIATVSVTTVSCTFGEPPTQGDLTLAWIGLTASRTLTAPSNFVAIDSQQVNTNVAGQDFYCLVTSTNCTSAITTFSWTTATASEITTVEYYGQNTVPIDVHAIGNNASSTTLTSPSATTVANLDSIITCFASDGTSGTTMTPGANNTLVGWQDGSTGTQVVNSACQRINNPLAASTQAQQSLTQGAAAVAVSATIGIAVAPAGQSSVGASLALLGVGGFGTGGGGGGNPFSAVPGSLAFANVGSPAQTVTLSGGTAPYSTTNCANTTICTTSLSSSVVTVSTNTAVGNTTFTVSDSGGNNAVIPVSVGVPTHIRNFAWYGLNDDWSIDIPVSYIASHMYAVEGDVPYGPNAHAQGVHAMPYRIPLNPHICPTAGGTSNNCETGDSASYYLGSSCTHTDTPNESAFLHYTSSLTQRVYYNSAGYTWDWMNPGTAITQTGVQCLAAAYPSNQGYDWMFCDNTPEFPLYDVSGGSPPYEYATSTAFYSAMDSFFGSLSQPCFTNLVPTDGVVVHYTTSTDKVVSEFYEANVSGCVSCTHQDQLGTRASGVPNLESSGGTCYGIHSNATNTPLCWEDIINVSENTIYQSSHGGNGLSVTINCGGGGNGSIDLADRNYCLASYWLIYDPNYTIYGENFFLDAAGTGCPGDPTTGGNGCPHAGPLPEDQVVPINPLHTLSSNGSNTNVLGDTAMCSSSKVCWREFGTIFWSQDVGGVPGTPVSQGNGIAIVNVTNASASIPTGSFTNSYTHCMVISNNYPLYFGSAISWTLSMPTTINAWQGLICRQ